ncbi:Fc.00g085380.m01.CDS01 [Cosmosporella sp. VM-42]
MASTRTLFQLDSQPTWFENISIRSNGTILATRLDVPELWAIDPTTGKGSVLLRLPESAAAAKALTGICELSSDVFAVGNIDYDPFSGGAPQAGNCAVWLADLTGEEPKFSKVVDIPEIGMINGMATWDSKTVLVTDCLNGKVYKLDVTTGSYSIALEDETMTLPPNAPFPFAINGLKVYRTATQAYVYYTTTTRASVFRIPVTADIQSAGPVETLASGLLCDDFAVAKDGSVYVCTNILNTIVKIPAEGGAFVHIAGEEKGMTLAGSTACVFGEGEKVLYVSTAGGNATPVDGKTEPAKVVEIKLA